MKLWDELKEIIWPTIIAIIVFGLLIYIWPHTDLYKAEWDKAKYKDFEQASFFMSSLSQDRYDKWELEQWWNKFEKRWGVPREYFEPYAIMERGRDYLNKAEP